MKITKEAIQKIQPHLQGLDFSGEVLDFLREACEDALNPTAHSYTYLAQPTKVDGVDMVGVWTDGVSLIADNDVDCEYPLEKGKIYKVTIREVDILPEE